MEIQECWSVDEENYTCDSLAELIAENEGLAIGDTVFVAEARHPKISELCNAHEIIDRMGESAYDIAGEWGEDYPNVTKEAEAELGALLETWVNKHCPPTFFTVEKSRPYVLTEDDVEEKP